MAAVLWQQVHATYSWGNWGLVKDTRAKNDSGFHKHHYGSFLSSQKSHLLVQRPSSATLPLQGLTAICTGLKLMAPQSNALPSIHSFISYSYWDVVQLCGSLFGLLRKPKN